MSPLVELDVWAAWGGKPIPALAPEHLSVYIVDVKRRELERKRSQAGWFLLRHGGNHDVWTNGREEEAVPRHSEINENLARKILKKVGAK